MKIFIVGAGGHARVVYDILSYDRTFEVVGFTDNVLKRPNEKIFGKPVLGKHEIWPELYNKGIRAAIVAVGDNNIRARHFYKLKKLGFELINAIHPNSSVAASAKTGKGVVVSAGAIINTNARIGSNCIINSRAVVEHECRIGNHVHVAPGACIAGRTKIGERSFIGIGSVVKEYLTIGRNVVVGAGSVVLDDVPDSVMVAGAPAAIKKRSNRKLKVL
jgi:sugar O-acyltransferase (sialic acid O-acetyltransferase NeuD family)